MFWYYPGAKGESDPHMALKRTAWHRGKYPSANDKEDMHTKGKVEDTCVVHAHKISVDNSD